jgi:DNA-binding NarL/FixJ family response regulator
MPNLTGKEVLGKLNQMGKANGTRVVIYSTTIATQDIEDTKGLGVAYHLQKPEDFDTLRKSVVSILSGNF